MQEKRGADDRLVNIQTVVADTYREIEMVKKQTDQMLQDDADWRAKVRSPSSPHFVRSSVWILDSEVSSMEWKAYPSDEISTRDREGVVGSPKRWRK